MKITCLINNYNYEEYVIDAVQSALNQTMPFDEIIVVDDGSTDRSVALLKENFASHPTVKLLLKENGGQLSCFYEGFLASTGDIIFFLDADDLYCENYLEEALALYKDLKCDFLFCSHIDFTKTEKRVMQLYSHTIDIGYSLILATWAGAGTLRHVGNLTSALSIRRDFLARLFPYPFMSDWCVQADVYLVFGSSMAGARKAYCHRPLVMRRLHERNNYAKDVFNKINEPKIPDGQLYFDLVRRTRFKTFLADKLAIDKSLINFADNEFKSIPNPSYVMLKAYLKLVNKTSLVFFKKLKKKASMYKHYFSSIRTQKNGKTKFLGKHTEKV